MKKLLSAALILSLLFVGQNCKKSNNPGNTNTNTNTNTGPQSTPVGTPTGTKTSKFIPKSGGTIASADGNLEIDFPNGALSADDTITIQPITNNCPGGIGLAYRLGPNGSKFNQPVTLKFHYDDSVLKTTLAKFMLLAFQDTSGVWFFLDNVRNDTINHIISSTTTHFTDFTFLQDVLLEPASATLKPGDNIHISVLFIQGSPNSGIAAPLKGNSATWAVNGITNGNSDYGTITVNPNVAPLYDYANYTAPGKAPSADKNPVLISAQFTPASNQKIAAEDGNGNLISLDKIILYAHILIIDGGYHVELSFEADSVNQSAGLWTLKDKGSFDVVFSGSSGSVTNIQNSDISISLIPNGSNCNPSLVYAGGGTINIVDSSNVVVNPILNNVNILFNSLDQKNYVKSPIFSEQCPGDTVSTSGGGYGPPFPAYIQFNKVDSTQTLLSGQYKIVVTPLK